MGARLVIDKGPLSGTELVLEEGQVWSLGKDADKNDIVLVDEKLAPSQLEITLVDGQYIVSNLNQDYPVLLNGKPIQGKEVLANASRLTFGSCQASFYTEVYAQDDVVFEFSLDPEADADASLFSTKSSAQSSKAHEDQSDAFAESSKKNQQQEAVDQKSDQKSAQTANTEAASNLTDKDQMLAQSFLNDAQQGKQAEQASSENKKSLTPSSDQPESKDPAPQQESLSDIETKETNPTIKDSEGEPLPSSASEPVIHNQDAESASKQELKAENSASVTSTPPAEASQPVQQADDGKDSKDSTSSKQSEKDQQTSDDQREDTKQTEQEKEKAEGSAVKEESAQDSANEEAKQEESQEQKKEESDHKAEEADHKAEKDGEEGAAKVDASNAQASTEMGEAKEEQDQGSDEKQQAGATAEANSLGENEEKPSDKATESESEKIKDEDSEKTEKASESNEDSEKTDDEHSEADEETSEGDQEETEDSNEKKSDKGEQEKEPLEPFDVQDLFRFDQEIFSLDIDDVAHKHIETDLSQPSRFLLKVLAGANIGAEFHLDSGKSYIVGSDADAADIVFNDTSVSHQHAKIIVGNDNSVMIEDLGSKNGVVIEGRKIEHNSTLSANQVVALGTTLFLLIDHTVPAKTIVATFAPEDYGLFGRPRDEEALAQQAIEEEEAKRKQATLPAGSFILTLFIGGLAVLFGIGTASLFHAKEITPIETVDAEADLDRIIQEFPSVRYTFNRGNGQLFLIGHVKNSIDKSELLYKVDSLPFVRAVDDNVINDEAVWQEMNILLSKRPEFKGVSMHSPEPGKFVISGYLKTENQAACLSEYLNLHFNYLSLLENKVIVETYLFKTVTGQLLQAGFANIQASFANGEMILTGYINQENSEKFQSVLESLSQIPGIRMIKNFVVVLPVEEGIIDLNLRYPRRYRVTGYSKYGDVSINVVINGRILTRGDVLDGMTITSIQPNCIFLEKDGLKYKIEYNKN